MERRRELYRLAEVAAELRMLGRLDVSAEMLSDLQQGALQAAVDFPDFREVYTNVPRHAWEDTLLQDFVEKLDAHVDIELPLADFARREATRLKKTSQAVARKDPSDIDSRYRKQFLKDEWLKERMTDADWRRLRDFCSESTRGLQEQQREARPLRPMVTARDLDDYISKVRAEMSRDSTPKSKGGRRPTDYWLPIYEEIIRRLARRDSALRDGEYAQFAGHVHNWAEKTIDKQAHQALPAKATIAQKLRDVMKVKAAPSD